MNDKTLKALDRALDRLERASQRRTRAGISTAPIVITLGLIVGYQLLVRFVPMVWSSLLPGGWDQVSQLRGWPGLVGHLALACHQNFGVVVAVIGIAAVTAFAVSRWLRPLRALVWLAAVAVILADAGIVYVVLRTSMEATIEATGLP